MDTCSRRLDNFIVDGPARVGAESSFRGTIEADYRILTRAETVRVRAVKGHGRYAQQQSTKGCSCSYRLGYRQRYYADRG